MSNAQSINLATSDEADSLAALASANRNAATPQHSFRPAAILATRHEVTIRNGAVAEVKSASKSMGVPTGYADQPRPGMIKIPGVGETTVEAAKCAGLLPNNWKDGDRLPFDGAPARGNETTTDKAPEAAQNDAPADTVAEHRVKVAGDIGNPIVVIDELEKAGRVTGTNGGSYDLCGGLLPLLEPATASRWTCPYFQVPFDLGQVSWVMSAHAEGFIGRRCTITPRTVVEAVCQKFYEHSTHYRQRRRLDNAGFNVARQTLSRNATHIAGFLEPVCDEIWRHVTSGHAAHMDETPLRTQAEGGCETTWLWGLCRDERGWNKEAEPAVYFEHDASRGGHVAERMPDGALIGGALIDTLQIDGWKAYNRIRRVPGQNEGVEIARCRTHARRKVSDSQKAAPSTLAKRVIKGLKAVYEVEERVYGCPPEERQALRLARSLPVLEKIRADLLRVQPDLAKGSLKTAVNYFLSGWEDLTRYVYDGRLAIDNNPVERCMRGIALSKKNSLFAGNLMAAKNWAIFYSLIETARLNGVDPFRYLSWVIDQIEKGRELTDYSQLMPWHFKAANEAPSQGKAA